MSSDLHSDEVRKALLIGVRHFGTAGRAHTRADPHRWRELVFAHDRVHELAAVLTTHRYDVDIRLDPGREAFAAALDTAVAGGRGPSIVHIISHGEDDPVQTERLDAVTADGVTGVGTNVAEWISTAQKLGRHTLFLVDLCHAGKVAHPAWLTHVRNDELRVWVIAASWADELAFDGRFTSSVATVLRQCAIDGLGTSPEFRFVSFVKVTQRINDEVSRQGGLPQTIAATRMNPAQQVELPFFPNPNWNGRDPDVSPDRLDDPLRSFLDERADGLAHFSSRTGHHFTGRADELRRLAPWCDGVPQGRPGLRLVTGSPGAGKSALIGALVSAAHPRLIAAAPLIRARLAREPELCPSPNRSLAAVHLRQRSLADVVSSIAGQLGLAATQDTVELFTGIAGLAEPPLIVVDALDEALHPDDIQALLLLPLAALRTGGGVPACRLLVGVRPWWDRFDALRRLAVSTGDFIDLDAVRHDVVERDLAHYLAAFLADSPAYSPARQRTARERLAAGIAARLTGAPRAAGPETPRWGAFLVATMYLSYLGRLAPAVRAADIDRLTAGVPLSLPDVFELDLRTRTGAARLRAALAATAFAKGDGMPIEVISTVAAALDPGIGNVVEVGDLLGDAGRFYLRTSVERDATTRYRMFHQGLADYLQRYPTAGPQGPRP